NRPSLKQAPPDHLPPRPPECIGPVRTKVFLNRSILQTPDRSCTPEPGPHRGGVCETPRQSNRWPYLDACPLTGQFSAGEAAHGFHLHRRAARLLVLAYFLLRCPCPSQRTGGGLHCSP